MLFFLKLSVRAYEHPGFVLRLILKQNEIVFEPDFNDFKNVLLNVFDAMWKCIIFMPRVETKLYSEWVRVCGCFFSSPSFL